MLSVTFSRMRKRNMQSTQAFKQVQVLHRMVFPVAFCVCSTQPFSAPSLVLPSLSWHAVSVTAVIESLSIFLAQRQRIIRQSAGKKRVPHLGDSFTERIREEMNTYGELHIRPYPEWNLRRVWLDFRHIFEQSQRFLFQSPKSRVKTRALFCLCPAKASQGFRAETLWGYFGKDGGNSVSFRDFSQKGFSYSLMIILSVFNTITLDTSDINSFIEGHPTPLCSISKQRHFLLAVTKLPKKRTFPHNVNCKLSTLPLGLRNKSTKKRTPAS